LTGLDQDEVDRDDHEEVEKDEDETLLTDETELDVDTVWLDLLDSEEAVVELLDVELLDDLELGELGELELEHSP